MSQIEHAPQTKHRITSQEFDQRKAAILRDPAQLQAIMDTDAAIGSMLNPGVTRKHRIAEAVKNIVVAQYELDHRPTDTADTAIAQNRILRRAPLEFVIDIVAGAVKGETQARRSAEETPAPILRAVKHSPVKVDRVQIMSRTESSVSGVVGKLKPDNLRAGESTSNKVVLTSEEMAKRMAWRVETATALLRAAGAGSLTRIANETARLQGLRASTEPAPNVEVTSEVAIPQTLIVQERQPRESVEPGEQQARRLEHEEVLVA